MKDRLQELFELREKNARRLRDAFLNGEDRGTLEVYETAFRCADAEYRKLSNEYEAKQRVGK